MCVSHYCGKNNILLPQVFISRSSRAYSFCLCQPMIEKNLINIAFTVNPDIIGSIYSQFYILTIKISIIIVPICIAFLNTLGIPIPKY